MFYRWKCLFWKQAECISDVGQVGEAIVTSSLCMQYMHRPNEDKPNALVHIAVEKSMKTINGLCSVVFEHQRTVVLLIVGQLVALLL